jgi:biopolymer transport protein TolR
MKFPRNARIFRGQLDAAPFASVFFLLVIFVLLTTLLYTPGVQIELPKAGELPGTDQPALAVALDKSGRVYFENRVVSTNELQSRLREAVKDSNAALTLVVQADKDVTEESLVNLAMLAHNAGINNLLLATLPPVFANPPGSDATGNP